MSTTYLLGGGRAGERSTLHRNAARTAFELVKFHGANARFVLLQKMDTHGQALESMSAKQAIVRNKEFFAAANKLYLSPDGKLKRGVTPKVPKPRNRKPGDITGKGSVIRIVIALSRLDLTYDVQKLTPDQLLALLPKEFNRWNDNPASRH